MHARVRRSGTARDREERDDGGCDHDPHFPSLTGSRPVRRTVQGAGRSGPLGLDPEADSALGLLRGCGPRRHHAQLVVAGRKRLECYPLAPAAALGRVGELVLRRDADEPLALPDLRLERHGAGRRRGRSVDVDCVVQALAGPEALVDLHVGHGALGHALGLLGALWCGSRLDQHVGQQEDAAERQRPRVDVGNLDPAADAAEERAARLARRKPHLVEPRRQRHAFLQREAFRHRADVALGRQVQGRALPRHVAHELPGLVVDRPGDLQVGPVAVVLVLEGDVLQLDVDLQDRLRALRRQRDEVGREPQRHVLQREERAERLGDLALAARLRVGIQAGAAALRSSGAK